MHILYSVHSISLQKYLDFDVKGFCKDPHNLDVALLKSLVENAVLLMPKYFEKAAKEKLYQNKNT
jgi:hypothetical protein